ncbi:thiamine ABC transporter ATP-binding protein [Aminobacter sp. HY435]|uniref:thiamine ABC transporter ATP-binding protein n=1 Tax=Aminobacter sp. HY435 TaxID=2970917 RepID=UPI0022B99091|nr:thiamine ABC transporter ATP-binding protein [Aminobacter sp. HY435]
MTSSASVQLDDVVFSYGETMVRFNVTFESSEITAVMGPSGAGKSTLLNLVAGFETPREGRVLIGGIDVTGLPPASRPVSMVFQENNLFAHLDVAANVGLGRSPSLRLTPTDRQDVAAALARVGLGDMASRLPRELSGGERQRVAIARVLVRDRPILLLDEPFASLGPALRDDMLALVESVQAERNMTVLFVTHQPEDARKLAQNMVFIEAGAIAATGKTADFFGESGPEAFRRYVGEANR